MTGGRLKSRRRAASVRHHGLEEEAKAELARRRAAEQQAADNAQREAEAHAAVIRPLLVEFVELAQRYRAELHELQFQTPVRTWRGRVKLETETLLGWHLKELPHFSHLYVTPQLEFVKRQMSLNDFGSPKNARLTFVAGAREVTADEIRELAIKVLNCPGLSSE